MFKRRSGQEQNPKVGLEYYIQSWKHKIRCLSISHKLILGFSLFVGLSFTVMGRNYLGNVFAGSSIERTQVIRVPAALSSGRAEANLLRMLSHIRGYLATGDSSYRDRYHEARQQFEEELLLLQDALTQDDSSENLNSFQKMQESYQQWKDLPEQLFTLRDNDLINQPALQLLHNDGESLIAGIQYHTQQMIDLQAQKNSSTAHLETLTDFVNFKSSFALLVSSLRGYLVTQNPSLRFEYGSYLIANNKAWEHLQKRSYLLSMSQRSKLEIVARQRSAFMKLQPKMFAMVESEQRRQDLYLYSKQAEPLANKMLDLLQNIVIAQQHRLSEELSTVNHDFLIAQLQTILGGGISVAFLLYMAWLLRRKITDPLTRLIEATTQIMEGDFDTKAEVESGDEIGVLATTFNQMTDYLKQSRQELKNHSHTLEEQAIALEAAIQKAESANQAKSVFLANMSHELRTPLNAILGFTQLMNRDTNLSETQRLSLRTINRSGEHLLNLINDILALSKVEAGKTSIHLGECDLNHLLESLEEMFRLKAMSKSLQLTIWREADVPRFIRTDQGKLKQILINLLDNAIKFTDYGHVSLRIKLKETVNCDRTELIPNHCSSGSGDNKPTTTLKIEIADTGFGISSEDLQNLFNPFVQTESGRSSQEGTGLGLAICRRFVSLLGGSLEVQSRLQAGTCFSFDLPVTVLLLNNMSVKTSNSIQQLAPGQQQPQVLIVEDKWENRQVLAQLLSTVGYSILEAENGQEGFEVWRAYQPDLILMDIQMPIMNGLMATQKIRNYPDAKQPTIIALSAGAFEEERDHAIEAGCNDFISKPFQERLLLEKMGNYLGVEYTYLDLPQKSVLEGGSEHIRAETNLGCLTQTWIQSLNHAAKQLNSQQIQTLLDDLPQEYYPLKSSLEEILHSYNFEEIIELTQEHLYGSVR